MTRASGVNAGPGFTSDPPSGADAAPDKAKGAPRALPAPLAIPFIGGCWECGRSWGQPGWVDAWIPDELWERIAPIPGRGTDGSGHLCIHCITAALTAIGAERVPLTVWAAPYA